MTYSTTITSKGQITLPAPLRARLKLQPGKRVTVRLQNNHLIIDAPEDLETLQKRNQAFLRQHAIGPITDAQIDDAWAASLHKKLRGKHQ